MSANKNIELSSEIKHKFINCGSKTLSNYLADSDDPMIKECGYLVEAKLKTHPRLKIFNIPTMPKTMIDNKGNVSVIEVPRFKNGFSEFCSYMFSRDNPNRVELFEAPHSADPSNGCCTGLFHTAVRSLIDSGMSFHRKTALITGCGFGSIGYEVAKCLLQGGCTVIATTSRPSRGR